VPEADWIAEARARATRARESIVAMAAGPHGAHAGGSLSAVDVLTVLYSRILRVRPDDPGWAGRDRFVMSKGHASAGLYAVLAEHGFIDRQECVTYARSGSRLAGHPSPVVPGVEFGTGSLGHGLSLGAGVALGLWRTGHPGRVYVLLGDGELQEGSVWEAAMAAAHLRLGRLTAVVDRNGLQISGRTEDCVALEPLADRWAAFGWSVTEVDGHDLAALDKAFTLPEEDRPHMIIARTVKGAGVPLFENKKKSHHVTLSPAVRDRALAGLRARTRNR
jgi:transketolase